MTLKRIGSETGSKPDETGQAEALPVIREYLISYALIALCTTALVGVIGGAVAAIIVITAYLTNLIFLHLAWYYIATRQTNSLRKLLSNLIEESKKK